MSEQKMKKSRSWSSCCKKEPGSCYRRPSRMRSSTISNSQGSTRREWTAVGGAQWTLAGAGSSQWSRSDPSSSATGPASGQGSLFQRDSAQVYAAGSRSLGFWIALQEEYGSIAQQRCWGHKTANILDKMPKSVQGKAKQLIHEMYLAPTRKEALAAYDQFISSYQTKFPKACECLQKDKEVLFTFYDFPAQH